MLVGVGLENQGLGREEVGGDPDHSSPAAKHV